MLRLPSSLHTASFWVDHVLLPIALAATVTFMAKSAFSAEVSPSPPPPPTPAAEVATPAATPDDLGLTPAALDKLDASQIVELVKERERTRRNDHSLGPDVASVAVPTGFFLAVILIVLITQMQRSVRERHKHETLKAMVEKGAAIPPELLAPPKMPGSDLRKGAIWLGIGLGVMGFFAFLGIPDPNAPRGLWGMGLLPALVGLGYLLTWWLESRHSKSH